MNLIRKFQSLLTPPARKSALALLGLMVIGMVMETLGIGLVIPALMLFTEADLGAQHPQLQPLLSFLGNPTQAQLVTWGMLGLVVVYVIKTVFLAYLAWRQSRFAFSVQEELSQRLFTAYLRQPYTFHLQRNSAQLIHNAINEVSHLTFNGIVPGMLIVTEGLVLIGIAALLMVVEPLGAVIVVVVLGGAAWAFQKSTRASVIRWGERRQLHEGLRMQHLQQGLGGAKDVKVLGRERDFLAQYSVHNAQTARAGQLQLTVQQLPRLWLELLGVVGLTTLVLTMVLRGRGVADIVPVLGLFGVAAFRLMPSVSRVLMAAQALRYGLPVINTLHGEIKLETPEPPRGDSSVPALQRSIELRDVSYTYPSARMAALRDVSITIMKGELVGIIGPSGAGKSTLVDILLGLLAPDSGEVAVDGNDIQQHMRAWQDQIGYVPQTIYLTDDTLRRNVAFGLPDDQIDEAAVRRAISAAQLNEFVVQQPEGLGTIVGERGVRLSGGQRQRIGIARALYHDPSILVLDEATSSLDTAIERGVMEAVTALHGAKTILIVAHRLSTVEHCERLYRLAQGRVVATGRPADLLPTRKVASSA